MPSPHDVPPAPGNQPPPDGAVAAGADAAKENDKGKDKAEAKSTDGKDKDNDSAIPAVSKGLDESARRRISYILLTLGVVLLAVSVTFIFARGEVARNALGIPIAAGLAIIFVGFLGGRAGWEIKAIGLSLGGSIAAFAGVYYYFFTQGDNAECPFSVPCRTPKIALQFLHTDQDHELSAVIMDCLRVRSSTVDWEKVEIDGVSGTIPNGNQYFLHRGELGDISISGKSDPTCRGALESVRIADTTADKEVYRVQHLGQMGPPGERSSYQVTYLSRKPTASASDETNAKQTKLFHAGELIVVTVYLAPAKSNKTN
jgi:hypothetical protein